MEHDWSDWDDLVNNSDNPNWVRGRHCRRCRQTDIRRFDRASKEPIGNIHPEVSPCCR